MPNEQEEFEFRRRFEQEQAASAAPQAAPPEEKTLAGFGGNLVQSGAKFASDIGQGLMAAPGLIKSAITDPVQVGEAAVEASKGIPDYLSKRYGGGQQILDTLYKDPIGFAADLSTLMAGGGAAAKIGGLGKVSEGLSTASKVVDPIAQVGRAVRAPAAMLGRAVGAPEKMYYSALKPSTAGAKGAERSLEVVRTGLREGIPVTTTGQIAAKAIIKDMQGKVNSRIAAIPAGKEFDTLQAAMDAVDEVKPKFTGVTKAEDWRKVDKTADVFMEGHPDNLSPAQTQEFKKASYRGLQDKAYTGQKGADVETEKAITRLAKEQLEQWAPGIDLLNEREGSVIELNKELGKAVARIRKHQMFGIGTPLMASAGHALGGPAGAWALASLKLAFDQPEFKSKLAIAITQSQKLKGSALTKLSTARRATEDEGQ